MQPIKRLNDPCGPRVALLNRFQFSCRHQSLPEDEDEEQLDPLSLLLE
jgi:hypothetical protein